MPQRDFIELNKAAIQAGLTTAHEQQQYRATHDIKRKDTAEGRYPRNMTKFPDDMVFGISTR